jgi:hypothetical protein
MFTFWWFLLFRRWKDWRSLSTTSFGEWICLEFCEWNDDIGFANVVVSCLGTSAIFDNVKEDCRRLIGCEYDGISFSIESDEWTAWDKVGLNEWRVDIGVRS